MKRICFIILLSIITFSCFDERVPDKYFVGSIWGGSEIGGVYLGDMLVSSYINNHLITIGESTFTHTVYRKEALLGSLYEDKDTTEHVGRYDLKYPKITLYYTSPKTEIQGIIEFEEMLVSFENGKQAIQLLRLPNPKK